MTEEDKPLEARDSKLLETDEDLREALRTFAAELLEEKGGDAETSPRSLYELMCRIRREFSQSAQTRWTTDAVCNLMRVAKDKKLISERASDLYGWLLREAFERFGNQAMVIESVRRVLEDHWSKPRPEDIESSLQDMQIIWGIRLDMTFQDNEVQSMNDLAWSKAHPDQPIRETALLGAGYNGFFLQNCAPGTDASDAKDW